MLSLLPFSSYNSLPTLMLCLPQLAFNPVWKMLQIVESVGKLFLVIGLSSFDSDGDYGHTQLDGIKCWSRLAASASKSTPCREQASCTTKL